TTPLVVDQKYSFPEFESVHSISHYRINNWQHIDSQSLIVQTAPSEYYLVVLRSKIRDMSFSERVSFTSTGTQIQAKFDCVQVNDIRCSAGQASPIEKIYRLNSKADVSYVREKIRNS
ncbi:MAG: hypothetical protein HKN08_01010, partial [Gammaproteobacteria bacterium]|nr:hypothetical protein [Gammaproteobacteria bacterium]